MPLYRLPSKLVIAACARTRLNTHKQHPHSLTHLFHERCERVSSGRHSQIREFRRVQIEQRTNEDALACHIRLLDVTVLGEMGSACRQTLRMRTIKEMIQRRKGKKTEDKRNSTRTWPAGSTVNRVTAVYLPDVVVICNEHQSNKPTNKQQQQINTKSNHQSHKQTLTVA